MDVGNHILNKKGSKQEWIDCLKKGDFGINYSRNIFGWLQHLYRKRLKEGKVKASHAWYVKEPPYISEANGAIIKGDKTYLKYIGDRTKSWVFRYKYLAKTQAQRMQIYTESAEETGGHYSVVGIWRFAKSFFSKKKDWKDSPGVFCSEYTSRIINAGGMQYIKDRDPWEISPSYQLNWFLKHGLTYGWELVAYYDGEGNYFLKG